MTAIIMFMSSQVVASKGKRRLSVNRSSRMMSIVLMCNLHPSSVAGAKRISASTSGPGTTLDYGESTNKNVQVSKGWR
jgi:hypothetical protein